MAVGYGTSQGGINQSAGRLSTSLRDLARSIGDFHTVIVSMGADATSRATALVALGFSQADADQMVYLADVLNTVAAIYYGTATQPSPFSFDSALSPLWGTS